MNTKPSSPSTAFDGHRRIASGTLSTVALAVKRAIEDGAAGPVLIFDDLTGKEIDIDIRGSDEAVIARLPQQTSTQLVHEANIDLATPRGRGRPKLGVIAREVTLLPRHWEWLNQQSGGASVALRKLVEQARRHNDGNDQNRQAQDAAYHFMSAIAGNMPGFEEATRALFANDSDAFCSLVTAWPEDIRTHVSQIAFRSKP